MNFESPRALARPRTPYVLEQARVFTRPDIARQHFEHGTITAKRGGGNRVGVL